MNLKIKHLFILVTGGCISYHNSIMVYDDTLKYEKR